MNSIQNISVKNQPLSIKTSTKSLKESPQITKLKVRTIKDNIFYPVDEGLKKSPKKLNIKITLAEKVQSQNLNIPPIRRNPSLKT